MPGAPGGAGPPPGACDRIRYQPISPITIKVSAITVMTTGLLTSWLPIGFLLTDVVPASLLTRGGAQGVERLVVVGLLGDLGDDLGVADGVVGIHDEQRPGQDA